MALNSLQELYVEQLRDMYDAENQIVKALPKMRDAASSQELRDGFDQHYVQSRDHIERLRPIFSDLGVVSEGKTCQAMKGLIKEGEEMMKQKADPEVQDAALIAAAQRVEHYEIAGYGTLIAWARQLNRQKDIELLQQTLGEEKSTDEKLTQLAEHGINVQATNGDRSK